MVHAELQAGPWREHCLPVAIHLRAGNDKKLVAHLAIELREQGAAVQNKASLSLLRLGGPHALSSDCLTIRAELCLPRPLSTHSLRHPSPAQLRQALLRASSDYLLILRVELADGPEHVFQQDVSGF
jgi:hypothetical protein